MNLNGKKIVITTGGGIGDSIMFTPALRRLKELYPACHITFVTRYPNQRVLEGLPYIDTLTYIKRGTLTSRLRVLPELFGADAVVFTDWQPQLLLAAKLLGIPLRAGYPREGHSLSKCLTKHIKPFVMTSPDFAAETNARVFSDALGIDIHGDMTKTDVAEPSREEKAHIKDLLGKIGGVEDYIVLSAFAALPERNWPIENAVEFAEKFEQRYGMPVLWTGSLENMIHVKGKVRDTRNLLGKTTVGEMIALLQNAKLLVTPDSGPMHIAGALGIPVVALFSKDLPSRWAPKKKTKALTLAMPCSPCTDEEARNCTNDLWCMRGITAEMVLEAASHGMSEFVRRKEND